MNALMKVQESSSVANEVQAIMQTMDSLGLRESECIPRVNILTYAAWKDKGRQVTKGSKACAKVTVWIPGYRLNKKGEKVSKTYPKTTSLFHVSQTETVKG